MEHQTKRQRKPNPREGVGFLSQICFWYTFGIFRQGYKTNIEESDLFDVIRSQRSKKLGDFLEEEFSKDGSIYNLLWKCYGKQYLVIGLVQLCVRTTMITLSPMALERLIAFFSPGEVLMTKTEAFGYAIAVILLSIVNYTYLHNYLLTLAEFGLKVRTAFCSLIYRKCLKLSKNALGEISLGKIVTLLTKDVNAFETIILVGNDIWIGFVQAGIVCVMIYLRIGNAAFVGMGFFLIVMPLQIYIGKKASQLRIKAASKTDERLQVTQETISSIKTIKMLSWENIFSTKITQTRRKEVQSLVKIFFVKVSVLLIGALTSKIAFYLLIMTYVWQGNSLSADLVYYIINCFQRLRHALTVLIPQGITESAELHAAIKRINSLLQAEELQESKSRINQNYLNGKAKISSKNLILTINKAPVLNGVSLEIDSCGMFCLTGRLGSGKSTYIKALLKDLPCSEGDININGTVSYASQEPWVFPSTIKQNIVFGQQFNVSRYKQVLDICALEYDIETLEKKDLTVIRDRAINLSKGQQARINLARALYVDRDIYFLDDCLSALDSNVKSGVFKKIKWFLRDKICLFVTTDLDLIRNCDYVIVMKEGRIESTYKSSEIPTNHLDLFIEDQSNLTEEDFNDRQEEENSALLPNSKTEESIYHEKKKGGKVEKSIYKNYIQLGGGAFSLISVLSIFIFSQISKTYLEKMVSVWVDLEQNISDHIYKNMTNTLEFKKLSENHSFVLPIYSVLVVATTILSIASAWALFNFTRTCSNRLHEKMVDNVVKANCSFFDSHLVGNILNRFSKDLSVVDEQLPFVLYEFIEIFLTLLGIFILITTVNLNFLFPTTIFIIILILIRKYYLPTGRNLQRLDAATRSPIIGHLNATLVGLPTIRACNNQSILIKEFDEHQDLYTSTNFTLKCCSKAFGFLMDMVSAVYIAVILLVFLIFDTDTSVGDVGLVITQAFMLTGFVQYGIRQWAELENKMTSVERSLEYTKLQEEDSSGFPPQNWPSEGRIKFEKVSLSFFQSKINTLKQVSFEIKSKEKVAIVGRTGAGKSSIISVLFRLYNVQGVILIDNVDISQVPLRLLRRKISIIPQDPVLFSGSIRENLSPDGRHTDEEIWRVIIKLNLRSLIPSLDFKLDGSESSFSSGQKQLLCLARAFINNNKIIVLDEATANVDQESDLLIQEVIKECLNNCTVIMIAHRLHSVLKYDKVMVISKGEVLEFDHPENLRNNKSSYFNKMLQKV